MVELYIQSFIRLNGRVFIKLITETASSLYLRSPASAWKTEALDCSETLEPIYQVKLVTFQKLNLGCLQPVACVRSGDWGFYIRLRNVNLFCCCCTLLN
jgi:hypothetical protein